MLKLNVGVVKVLRYNNAPMDKLAKSSGLDPEAAKAYCRFDSDWGHKCSK